VYERRSNGAGCVGSGRAAARSAWARDQADLQLSLEDLGCANQGPDLEITSLRLHLRDRRLADTEKPGELGLREPAPLAKRNEVLLDAHPGEPLLDARGQVGVPREGVGEPTVERFRD
jgi:hypothetical protein